MTEVVLVVTQLDFLKHISSEQSILRWTPLQKVLVRTDRLGSFFGRFQIDFLKEVIKKNNNKTAWITFVITQSTFHNCFICDECRYM